jgi:hypothetical protein
MDATERHERMKEIEAGMKEALRLRAEHEERFDALHLEYELLGIECFDENCPCVEDDPA